MPHGSPGVLHERREDWRWRAEQAELTSGTPGGKDHGAQRSGPRPGNEVFALLGRTGTRHCPVPLSGISLSTAGVFGFAPTAVPPFNLAGTGLGGSGRHCRLSDRLHRRSTPVRAPPPTSPPGEASGSERPRLPPQIGPQPTHPVRQNIARHSEVSGDVAVSPTVYDPALQQRAVAWVQFPEKGAELVTSHGFHWGDLGA